MSTIIKPRKESKFIFDNVVRISRQFAAVEWSKATEPVKESLRQLFVVLRIDLMFCKLCGHPFSPKRTDQEFCCTKHSEKYYNGFKRQA